MLLDEQDKQKGRLVLHQISSDVVLQIMNYTVLCTIVHIHAIV